MAEPFVYDTGAKKFILGGGVDDVGNNIPRFEFKKERFIGKMADKTGKELDKVLMADPKLKEKYKTSQELYNDLQKYNESLDNPAPVETPVMDIPVNKNKAVTPETVEASDDFLCKYMDRYLENKNKSLSFLKPIAKGFAPEVTTKATSLFGQPVNASILSALGGLSSGLSEDTEIDTKNTLADMKSLKDLSKGDGVTDLQKIELSEMSKMSDDYRQDTKSVPEHLDAYNKAQLAYASSNKSPNGQADLNLLYAYARLNNPTGIITDKDFQQALSTGSYGEQAQSWFTKAFSVNGAAMPKDLRNRLYKELNSMYKDRLNRYKSIKQQYIERIEGKNKKFGLNINPNHVILDYTRSILPEQEIKDASEVKSKFTELELEEIRLIRDYKNDPDPVVQEQLKPLIEKWKGKVEF